MKLGMKLTNQQEKFYDALLSWYHKQYHRKENARVVVGFTGGRNYKDSEWVGLLVSFFHVFSRRDSQLSYHVGDCKTGVDKYVWDYVSRDKCLGVYWQGKQHKAYWEKFRQLGNVKKAGPERNGRMLDEMLADSSDTFLLSFEGGKGTLDCTSQAREKGIKIFYPDNSGYFDGSQLHLF